MHCEKCRTPNERSHFRSNLFASLFAIAGIGVLYANFDPEPVGGNMETAELDTVDMSEFTSFNSTTSFSSKLQAAEVSPVEAPVQTALLPEPVVNTAKTASAPSSGIAQTQQTGEFDLKRIAPCEGEAAVKLTQQILEYGLNRLKEIPDYTSTFVKQERIAGQLADPTLINLKVRHQPFSVYMKWHNGDKGRELLYVDGQNKGDMVVRVGGIRGRILPALNLDPHGDLAMKESRHPITEIGIKGLILKALKFREKDLKNLDNLRCMLNCNASFDKQDCLEFAIEYMEQKPVHEYRKSVLVIEKENGLPIAVRNFAWPNEVDNYDENKIDESTLIENYAYTNVSYTKRLADLDFNKNNKKYRFRK